MTDQPEPEAAAGGAAQMDEETLELAHRLPVVICLSQRLSHACASMN